MNRHPFFVALVVAALAAGLVAAAGAAAPTPSTSAWLRIRDVRPGMRGIGKTVVRGTAIETFDVEVLDVVPGAGPAGDLFLVRVSGPLIRRTGGIAAGMSGSPVFVDGRLLGAIGFGWAFADHSLGLVTPIEVMLRALPAPKPRSEHRLRTPLLAGDRRIERIAMASTPAEARALEAAAPHLAAMVPLARPLLLSGSSPRIAELLAADFAPYGVTPVQGAAGGSTNVRPPLEPGSAIGVQLIRGDLNAVAIGTLTYRDGDAVLAFGHPFLNRGDTQYLLTAATVHGVVTSANFPFKIGSAGAPVGIVSQDRRSGIGGRLGMLPPVVGVRARVTDGDRGRDVTITTQVVRDAQLGPLLALISAVEAVDRALDRVGEGTAQVRLVMRAQGLAAPVVRENVFYHARDIGTAAMLELPEALRLMFANEFVRTGPVDVNIQIEVRQSRQTAALIEAELDRPRARPGDVVTARITLRPFQGAPSVRAVEITVPDDFPTGQATVLIRAGGRPVPEQGLLPLLTQEPIEAPARSAAEQLSAFSDRDRNTDLIVELIPGAARFPGSSPAAMRTVRVRMVTPWVVRGRVQLSLGVEPR